MATTFTITNDGSVDVVLPEEWKDMERALNDCLGSRPPAGLRSKNGLSTFWLDRVLSLIRRNDGQAIELAAGNMSHLVLDDQTVRVVADYETHDDTEIPVFWFEALLEQWRSRVIEAASCRPNSYGDDERPGRRTYASLRVFSEELTPTAISHLLQCEPTSSYVVGDAVGRSGRGRTMNGWFLDSQQAVSSQELGRHIDQLLARSRVDCLYDKRVYNHQGRHSATAATPHAG